MSELQKRILEKIKARGDAEQSRADDWRRSLKPTVYRGNNLFQEMGGEPLEGRYLGQQGLVPGQTVPNIGRNPNKPVIPGLPVELGPSDPRTVVIDKLKYIIVFSIIRPFESGESDDTIFPAIKACWRRYLSEYWWSYYYHFWNNGSISDRSRFQTIGYRDYYSFDGGSIQYMKTDQMSTRVSSGVTVLGIDEDIEVPILTIPAQTRKDGVNEYSIDNLTIRDVTYELIFKPNIRKLDRKVSVIAGTNGVNRLGFSANSGVANPGSIANYVVVPTRTTANPIGPSAGLIQPGFAARQSTVVVNRQSVLFDHDEIINPLRINLPEVSRQYEMKYFTSFTIAFLPQNSSVVRMADLFDNFSYTGVDTFIQEFIDFLATNFDFSSSPAAIEILDTYGYNLSDYVTIEQGDNYVRLVPTMKEVKVVGYIQFNQIVLGDSYENSYTLEKPLKAIPCITRQGHNIYFTRNPDILPLNGSPTDENANASITISTSDLNNDNILTLPEEWIKKLYSGIISSKPALNNVDAYYNAADDSIQFFKKSISTSLYQFEVTTLPYSKIYEKYHIGINIKDATYFGVFAFTIYDGLDRSVSESYSIIPSDIFASPFANVNLAINAISESELADGGTALSRTGLGGVVNAVSNFIQPAVNGTVTVTVDSTQPSGSLLHYVNYGATSSTYAIDASGAVGDTSIVIDNGSGSGVTNLPVVGDKFTIEGSTQQYTVTSVTDDSPTANETTLGIEPALDQTIANGDIVTFEEVLGSYEVVSSSYPTMSLKNLGLTNDAAPGKGMGKGTFAIASPVFLVINKSQDKPIYVEVENDDSITVGINVDHPHNISTFSEHLRFLRDALAETGIESVCNLNYDETNGNLTLEQSGAEELVFGYTSTTGFFAGLNIVDDETYSVFSFLHTGGAATLNARIENFYKFDKLGESLSIQWELRRIISPESDDSIPWGTYFFGNDKGSALAQVFNGYSVDTQDVGVKYTYRSNGGEWQSILVDPDDDAETRLEQYQVWDFRKQWLVNSLAEYNFYNVNWRLRDSYAFNKQTKKIIEARTGNDVLLEKILSLFGYKKTLSLFLSNSWATRNTGNEDDSLPLVAVIARNRIASIDEPNFELSDSFWTDLPDLTFPVIDLSELPEIEGIPPFSGILEDVAVNQEPYLQVFLATFLFNQE